MERYVIINADDFGMCRSANLAVLTFSKGRHNIRNNHDPLLMGTRGSSLRKGKPAVCNRCSPDLYKRMEQIPLGSRKYRKHSLPA